ncbi:hypothetical protein VM1G_05501 [Cytospora mali]|uniref:Uncharacterized protein n=1 Tax=Cytospora mali TaxID=578113 RepID=A0A194VZM5_CYTMA|nr:hypothetical protein VM1G_05501 [Valsa mali]
MESSSHLVSGRDSPLTVHPNGSKAPKSHSLDLKKVFVNGFQQQISHSATLSLKDGDGPFSSLPARAPGAISAVTYRNHMQIHIDGKTLANWDLSQLIQHKLIGGDGFYSFADMKMLKLALPLPTIGLDHENQPTNVRELGS